MNHYKLTIFAERHNRLKWVNVYESVRIIRNFELRVLDLCKICLIMESGLLTPRSMQNPSKYRRNSMNHQELLTGALKHM